MGRKARFQNINERTENDKVEAAGIFHSLGNGNPDRKRESRCFSGSSKTLPLQVDVYSLPISFSKALKMTYSAITLKKNSEMGIIKQGKIISYF